MTENREATVSIAAAAMRAASADAMRRPPDIVPGVFYAWMFTDEQGVQAFIVMPQPDGRAIVLADVDKRRLDAWRPAMEGMVAVAKTSISLVRLQVQEVLEAMQP